MPSSSQNASATQTRLSQTKYCGRKRFGRRPRSRTGQVVAPVLLPPIWWGQVPAIEERTHA